MISVYSLFWTILNCSIMSLALRKIRRSTWFLLKYGVSSLLLLTICCTVRMMIPLEFPHHQFILKDRFLLPLIQGPYHRYLRIAAHRPTILFICFIISILYLSLYLSFYISILRRIIRNRVPVEDEISAILHCHDSECPMNIYISPDINVPLTAGVLNPNIYLPDQTYKENELRYIILHEYSHWLRRDSWKKLFYHLFHTLIWWNPGSYILNNEVDQILEFQCDQSLTDHFSENEKMDYLEVLYKTGQKLNYYKKRNEQISSIQPGTNLKTKKCLSSALMQRSSFLLFEKEHGHFLEKVLLICGIIIWMTASLYFLPKPYYAPPCADNKEMLSIASFDLAPETYSMPVRVSSTDMKTNLISFDQIGWIYRRHHGKIQKRRWNYTKGYWIDRWWKDYILNRDIHVLI